MLNAYAPPFKIVGLHFIFACIYLVGLFFIYFIDQINLAFLHCFFIGFLLNTIFGSLYQLSSVVYEKALVSTKGTIFACLIFNIALCGLLYSFLKQNPLFMLYSGILIAIFIFYFLLLFLFSFHSIKTFPQLSLLFGVIFLGFGTIFALILIGILNGIIFLDMSSVLYYHIYFMLGSVFFISIGAGSLLLPMFLLNHKQSLLFLKISIFAYILSVGSYAIFAALAIILFSIWGLITIKNRMRKPYDFYNLNLMLSFICLTLASVLLIFKYFETALEIFIFGGILPFLIGHLYKILPFLIWYHYIAQFSGKKKVPMLNDMVKSKVALFTLAINLILVIVSVWYPSLVIIFLGIFILSLAINLVYIFSYINFKGV